MPEAVVPSKTVRQRWKKYLFHASRSQGFLWKFALAVIVGAGVIGYLAGRVGSDEPAKLGERILARSGVAPEREDFDDPDKPERIKIKNSMPVDILPAFELEINQARVEFVELLWAVPLLAPQLNPGDVERIKVLLTGHFSPAETDLAADYLAAWDLSDRGALERIRAGGEMPQPIRFARYVAGEIEMKRRDYAAAVRYFRQEGNLREAYESRYMVVRATLAAKDFSALAALQADADYRDLFSNYEGMKIAAHNRDWFGLLRWVVRDQIESDFSQIMLVALIAGCGWAFFLAHLGEWPGMFSIQALLCLAAFICGFVSTIPTVYLVVIQEDIFHFPRGGDLYRTFAYDIGGVALREELCKLLCFLPLLPILLKRDRELEVMILAGFVGLGFAVEENSGYFMMSGATSATGRFLTANFFHVALTGVNGLALFRAFTRGKAGLNEFLFVLPLTILAHGAYDALLDAPGLEFGGYLAMGVFVAFCLFFFNQVHELRQNLRNTIGLTGAFVFGISLLAAVVIIFQMINLGPVAGATVMFSELLGSAVMLLMFFRVFNEQLSA